MLRWKEKRGWGGRDGYKIDPQATSHLSWDDGMRQKREVELGCATLTPSGLKGLLLQLLEELPLAEDRYLVQGHTASSWIAHIQ